MKYISKNIDQTHQIAQELAIQTKPGTVFALYGDLGSGKTSFVQGFAKALQVEHAVQSPTFVIQRMYPLPDNQSAIYHVDLYRVQENLENTGIQDLLNPESGFVFIEWPEKIEDLLPQNHIKIRFEHIDSNTREIEIIK